MGSFPASLRAESSRGRLLVAGRALAGLSTRVGSPEELPPRKCWSEWAALAEVPSGVPAVVPTQLPVPNRPMSFLMFLVGSKPFLRSVGSLSIDSVALDVNAPLKPSTAVVCCTRYLARQARD